VKKSKDNAKVIALEEKTKVEDKVKKEEGEN